MADIHRPHKNITPELPPEIWLFHILPRLPIKSLLRVMSVCRQWRSIIKTPTFANVHLHRVTTNGHHENSHKLLVLSTITPCSFRTMDCETPEDDLTTARSFPFKTSPENVMIIASLNGLVCVGIKKCRYDDDEYSDLILWNPVTGDYKTLSKANSNKQCYKTCGIAFGLYYSCADDDYKLLRVTIDRDAYIYSLRSDSWRMVESTQEYLRHKPSWFSESWNPSTFLNEKLYFLKQVKRATVSPQSYSIIQFDVKTEKLTETAAPSFGNLLTGCLNMTVLRGCIHLTIWKAKFRHWCRTMEMWRMDEDGDWGKMVTYCSIPSFPWFQQQLHLMRSGNWLMHSEYGIYEVDLEKDTKVQLYTHPANSIIIHPRGKYIQTFVSPNQYTYSI
ncbi:F-box/kelch-repeat protein At3g06240-like [Cynara cardunculus var. scolymus]|uniref:F-box/kelch-repeat protein At3g06240-like n=1 Tax=Cynara cardunculus var. scolymus TaxID=59895 RepID=UPI000D62B551|nr:F-box/kelch-repeat protein At3g06240-like [Cynara cardunculus var. scolymus]